MDRAELDRLAVTVVCSPRAGETRSVSVSLPAGATVRQAIDASGLAGVAEATPPTGIWGKPCALDERLRDGDRVELYRPLLMAPMDARRARQRQQAAPR